MSTTEQWKSPAPGTELEVGTDPYYDPFDFEIDADPYPTWRRLRDEAPLYRNDRYDFYALSRFDDVAQASKDWQTYSSAKGTVLEIIKSGLRVPPGMILFEDPPLHDYHRGLVSRVFTPKKMNALESKLREFCARSLDPHVGAGRFDFIADLGAQMPMRAIGMLLGIPEQDQNTLRARVDDSLKLDDGTMPDFTYEGASDQSSADLLREYIDWRTDHPSDDLMTELLHAEFEDETGDPAPADPPRGPELRHPAQRGRQRDHHPPHRLDRQAPGRASRPAAGSWPRTGSS